MTAPAPLPAHLVEAAVRAALEEDLGFAGDITSNACIPASAVSRAAIVARCPGTVAGVALAVAAFRNVDPSIKIDVKNSDGARVAKGDVVLSVEGSSRSILASERVALNFLGHLSGIATATSALVDAAKGTKAKIVCTRKTTPGLRAFEKHAVLCGGGHNHRFGLYDAVMIKDNHIAAAGGVEKALKAAKASVGHMVKIEVEVDDLAGLEKALAGGADIVMLDNMSLADMKRAVEISAKTNGGRAVIEASGNVTLESVRAIAETGVDIISSGWITHSAPSLDLGLDFQ